MKLHGKTIFAISILCIAMAALESAVVVYLRALYYADGFTVSLKIIDQKILLVEIARELATLIMLMAIGYLAGNNFKTRFAYFLMAFAVWDIFYYVWLKVFLDWPASFFEWDILFLIPFTWLGPVLAPIICSVTMLLLSLVILRYHKPLEKKVWVLLIGGSVIILYTFLKDYGEVIITNGFLGDYLTIMQNDRFLEIARNYIPQSFSWGIFSLGELLIMLGIIGIGRKINL
jgi:hypothetical protein